MPKVYELENVRLSTENRRLQTRNKHLEAENARLSDRLRKTQSDCEENYNRFMELRSWLLNLAAVASSTRVAKSMVERAVAEVLEKGKNVV